VPGLAKGDRNLLAGQNAVSFTLSPAPARRHGDRPNWWRFGAPKSALCMERNAVARGSANRNLADTANKAAQSRRHKAIICTKSAPTCSLADFRANTSAGGLCVCEPGRKGVALQIFIPTTAIQGGLADVAICS